MIPVFALVLSIWLVEAVPPPRLIKGPVPLPVPQIAIARQQIKLGFINPAQGIPGTVKIPSNNPRRAIPEEHLLTHNGETFRGTFLGFDPAEGLKWSHPDFQPSVIHFLPDRVSRLNLKVAPLPVHAKHHSCRVELSNGDTVAGDLVSMNNGKLTLDTWYAGKLAINTAHIKSIKPGASISKVFFEGPKDNQNWSFNNQQNGALPQQILPQLPIEQQKLIKERAAQAANGPTWKFANGTFESTTSNSMVGRKMKEMPKRSSIEFNVDWTSSLSLYINFLTDSLASYSQCNGYCLRLTQSYIYLYRYNFNNGAGRGGRLGNNVRVSLANLKGNAHVALKTDETKNTIALFINGTLIQKWENVGEFPEGAKGLLFTSRTTNRMKLSRIRVTDWNGSLPDPNASPKSMPEEDYVLLKNADQITGDVLGIAAGKLQFKSDFGEMAIALDKVGIIHRATERVKPLPIAPGMERAIFKDGGSMTMKITGWKDGKVTTTSPIFSEAEFDAAVFQSIDFNDLTTKPTTAVSPQLNPSPMVPPNILVPRQLQQRVLPAPRANP